MEIKQIKLAPDMSWQTEQLKQVENYARVKFIPVMLTSTATLLHNTLVDKQPTNILEIGTAIGYSGTIILNTCPHAHLTTIEVNPTNFDIAKHHFASNNLNERVTQHLGDAMTILQQLVATNKQFDFVFLDGPKGQYINYLPLIQQLLTTGGVLFADDVLYMHLVDGPEHVKHKHRTIVVNLRKYLQQVTTDNWHTDIIDIDNGVAISTKLKD